MKKEIVIEHKENKDYKLILRVNLNEEYTGNERI
jgi:hypothetical protein